MTSRERLWAVLNGQEEPDRVPIWMLFPREKLGYYVDVHCLPSYRRILPIVWSKTDWLDRRHIRVPPFYTAAAQIQSCVQVRYGWTTTRYALHTPLGDLTAEHRQDNENAAGAKTEYFCKTIADLEKVLAIPYEPAEPDLTDFCLASAKLGDAGLMMADLQMPIGVAYGLTHPQTFSMWTLTDRERLIQFTQVMFERQAAFLKKALDKGLGPVFFSVGTEFIAPPMCSPGTFDALTADFDRPLFDLIHNHGGKVIVHHHGKIDAVLDRIADLGADGIHPIEEPPVGDCTMAEASKRIGNRICLVGSVQYDDFERLAPEEMEELVRRQILDAATGGRMILAPTAGPYAARLTERQQENTVRFIEAGQKWGRYPLARTSD